MSNPGNTMPTPPEWHVVGDRPVVLLAENDDAVAAPIREFLTENGFDVRLLLEGQEISESISEIRPDLLISNLLLSTNTGSDLCATIRQNPATASLPVILYSPDRSPLEQKLAAFQSGADDVLCGPFESVELLARALAVLRRHHKKPAASRPDAPRPARNSSDFLRRFAKTLSCPGTALATVDERRDFVLAIALVLGAPLLSSLGRLPESSGGLDGWIGAMSLGLLRDVALWFATAGLLHVVLPFENATPTMRRCLAMAGLAWAPRLLGAALASAYAIGAHVLTGLDPGEFSSGIDLVVNGPSHLWATAGRIGVFDLWSAAIALAALRGAPGREGARWSLAAILVGVICVAFGALSPY